MMTKSNAGDELTTRSARFTVRTTVDTFSENIYFRRAIGTAPEPVGKKTHMTKKPASPTDFSPALLPERLHDIAEVLAGAKNEQFAKADEDDGGWGVGCHGFDRGRIKLKKFAPTTDYLTFQSEGSLSYWIKVDGVPIQICRTDKEPTALRRRHKEALAAFWQQLSLAYGAPFVEDSRLAGLVFRLELNQTTDRRLQNRVVDRADLVVYDEVADIELASWQVWPRTATEFGSPPPNSPNPVPPPIPLRAATVKMEPASFEPKRNKENADSGD